MLHGHTKDAETCPNRLICQPTCFCWECWAFTTHPPPPWLSSILEYHLSFYQHCPLPALKSGQQKSVALTSLVWLVKSVKWFTFKLQLRQNKNLPRWWRHRFSKYTYLILTVMYISILCVPVYILCMHVNNTHKYIHVWCTTKSTSWAWSIALILHWCGSGYCSEL